MKTDPTDNGGLFVGRRPGTRAGPLPRAAGARQRRAPARRRLLAGLPARRRWSSISLLSGARCPLAWLWVGSQVDYLTGSVGFGILVAFVGLLVTLLFGLVVLRRLDHAWILVRRAAGHDQRAGTIGRVFAATASSARCVFAFWFLVIHGPGLGAAVPAGG